MNFAQKLLQKYGWKEGEGLGKNSDGISKPLKANLKFDNAGLGVDKADEFNNHWWERVFNEAANNVDVKTDGANISVSVKNEESVEISTKNYSVRKLKKQKRGSYDNFLSSATLTNTGNEVKNEDRIEIDDIAVSPYKSLTDEELFAACGGRTAHKGARHGLKLSGKLARLEKQERELLEKNKTSINSEKKSDSWIVVKSKKKKRNDKVHEKEDHQTGDNKSPDPVQDALYTAEYCIKSKKKRKEKKKIEEELLSCLDSFSLEDNEQNKIFPAGICDASKAIKKAKKEKKSKKSKSQKGTGDWDTYRKQLSGNECSDIVAEEKELNESLVGEVPSATGECAGRKKKSKKCKHGIDKEAKETYKKAKKIRKNLKHVTKELERSILASI